MWLSSIDIGKASFFGDRNWKRHRDGTANVYVANFASSRVAHWHLDVAEQGSRCTTESSSKIFPFRIWFQYLTSVFRYLNVGRRMASLAIQDESAQSFSLLTGDLVIWQVLQSTASACNQSWVFECIRSDFFKPIERLCLQKQTPACGCSLVTFRCHAKKRQSTAQRNYSCLKWK